MIRNIATIAHDFIHRSGVGRSCAVSGRVSALARERLAATTLLMLFAAGCLIGQAGPGKGTVELFPVNGLEHRVQFWEDVFTRYGRNDALIHDRTEVGLVYEVVRLEGDGEHNVEAWRQQRAAINRRTAHWRLRLRELSSRLGASRPLDPDDLALLGKVERALGRRVGAAQMGDLADDVHVQRGIRELFLAGWIRSGRYLPHMERVFTEMGVPREILAIPLFESSFRSESKSRKGATGVWQFMRSTGRLFLRIDGNFDERLDPLLATRGAGRFLLDARRRLGSWPLAVMAYNHGLYGILNARRRVGDDPMEIIRYYSGRQFGYASRNYYPEFLAALRIMQDPESHLPGVTVESPWEFTSVPLKQPAVLATVLHQHGFDQKTFFEYNPSVIRDRARPGLRLPAGFPLRIPPGPSEAAAQPAPAKGIPPPTQAAAPAEPPRTPKSARPARAQTTAGGRVVHVVQPRDTLFSLARRYGTSVDQIRRLNRLLDDTICVGQRLLILP